MKASGQAEPAEGFIDTADGRIHYLDWGGSGRATHFLHGNGFCAGTYNPFIKYLIEDLHIIASDVRGHGDSVQLNHKRIRHWKTFAEDLKTLVEQTLPPPVIGIGHSLGAVATYIAAAQYPRLFAAIILIDPVILPRKLLALIAFMTLLGLKGNIPLAKAARRRRQIFQGKKEALKLFAAGRGIFKSWSREFVDAYLECGLLEKDAQTAILKCDPELEAQIFESVPLDVWRYAPKIACPVQAIRGAHSDIFGPAAAERLGKIIPDYEWETIPDSGHFIPMEKPQACARAIADFIQRRLAPPS
ncbi:MAG: alpha/beta hydrolase [Desulfobacterales bacterium]|nr:MAG: alpha/beta hydrolase [Desulfobacterales bacterium]